MINHHQICGNVDKIDVDKKRVFLETGEKIEFTHCIIAVGSLGPIPARSRQPTIDELLSEYIDMADKIGEAKHVCIIGGGPVGVELAELRPDLLLVLREVAVAPDKLILVKAGQA